MHYVPDSARDFLPDDAAPRSSAGLPGASFHYQSAPVYLLTLVVGALLAADLLIGLFGDPAWASYRAPFGYRLALLAAVLGGGRILYQTLDGLFEGRVGAELALSIAALAAILLGEHMTAALVVFIALCGESVEGYTLDRAQSAIRRIFDLCPNLAHVVRGGREVDVPVDQVREGETVTIRPGEARAGRRHRFWLGSRPSIRARSPGKACPSTNSKALRSSPARSINMVP